jgi:phytoene dehydrogenase-like protein
MIYDVIVIGAGIGGLACAAKLAKNGLKVLVLEKNPHIGGTSYIFKRGGYSFPMGPLSIGFPGRVQAFFEELGIPDFLEFKRNHFQLVTPFLDIVYSRPLKVLADDLANIYPEEAGAIRSIMARLEEIISLAKDVDRWHPDYLAGKKKKKAIENLSFSDKAKMEAIAIASTSSCREILDRTIGHTQLRNLIGSQGTDPPEMSLLNLAFMWNIMSEVGIWFPSCGLDGLCHLLRGAVHSHGGDIKLAAPVAEIFVQDKCVGGVRTSQGDFYRAGWVVSNVDAKKTILELVDPSHLEGAYLEMIRDVPYTGSELCVYLGIDPRRTDLGRMKATHVFFRKEVRPEAGLNPEDFDNREIEICRWSDNALASVPAGRASLVLRVSFPYDYFSGWRTAEKTRKDGYKDYKIELARRLVKTVESILPGLSGSVEVMEIATPLTYRDWGQRSCGSIAGWTWSAESASILPGELLIETPIRNLLMAGIYAATELFLGGVPTAMHTASLAADLILEYRR